MADILSFEPRGDFPHNIITSEPIQFRWADWQTGHAIQCTVSEAEKFEEHRKKVIRAGHKHISFIPNHFSLFNGYHHTILGLFQYRDERKKALEVYHLAGLMECVVNGHSPILRTDLLRNIYKKIVSLRKELGVVWRGRVHHFLLPLHPEFYGPNLFLCRVNATQTLKDLYEAIFAETEKQFAIIQESYVFYLPKNRIFIDYYRD